MTPKHHTSHYDIRFRDLDIMGHVNNAVYATYLEQARIDYFNSLLNISLGDANTVIVHIEIDYIKSLKLGDTVDVSITPSSVGNSSLTLDYVLHSNSNKIATARTVQVLLDGDGIPTNIPDQWREKLI
jgi:acyl-CoA thioester hydrolase